MLLGYFFTFWWAKTINDIKRILHFVYHFPKKVELNYHDILITDKTGSLLKIDAIKKRPEEDKDLIELTIFKYSYDSEEKGLEGAVNQDIDISIGRPFKRPEIHTPSSSVYLSFSRSNKTNIKIS